MKFSGENYLYFGDKGTDKEGRKWELHLVGDMDAEQFDTIVRILSNSDDEGSDGSLSRLRQLRDGLGDCIVCGEHVPHGWQTDDGQFALCHEHADHRHAGYMGLAAPERDGMVTIYGVSLEKVEEMRAEARKRNERRMRWEESLADEGKEKCRRCGGYGIIEAYRHVNGGVCFDCGGRGWTEAT